MGEMGPSSPDSVELMRVFGSDQLVPLQHPNQRNRTWLLRTDCQSVVLKRYSWASNEKVTNILQAERCARIAGVPAPSAVWRSLDGRLVAYEHAPGAPGIPERRQYVEESARFFVQQLHGFRAFNPMLAPVRPVQPPLRAQAAVGNNRDSQLARVITDTWHQLGEWALRTPATASHVDWRADNILCSTEGVSAVLDWEDIVRLPAAEAVGYAAGSLTHSWREKLYRPLSLEPTMRFLTETSDQLEWLPGADIMRHARLAALFTAAVRLAEDQQRNRAIISLDELRSALGG